jgi:hypothetical protein
MVLVGVLLLDVPLLDVVLVDVVPLDVLLPELRTYSRFRSSGFMR